MVYNQCIIGSAVLKRYIYNLPEKVNPQIDNDIFPCALTGFLFTAFFLRCKYMYLQTQKHASTTSFHE